MKPYRLLILTASTGGGHDARADALAAWAREFYQDEIDVKILRPLEANTSPVGHFGVELYNFIQRRIPLLHHLYFPIIEIIGDLQGDKFLGRREYEKTLKDFRPQMIVSLHDFLNRGYFKLAKEILGNKVRCTTYCGEYSGGSGFSKHWTCPEVDRWVGRTEGALREAYQLGISPEKMEGFTFFLPPDESETSNPALSRHKLHLDDEKLTILFASGRNGAIDHPRFLKALEPYKDRIQAIVVCGLNERMRREVEEWQQRTNFPAIIEGYSSRLSDYMRLSDVVFFRGGANTATRAFFESCPMWFDASEGIMPQEHLTVDFFMKEGVAAIVASPKDLTQLVEAELNHRGAVVKMRQTVRSLREKYNVPPAKEFFREFLEWGLFAEKKEQLARAESLA